MGITHTPGGKVADNAGPQKWLQEANPQLFFGKILNYESLQP